MLSSCAAPLSPAACLKQCLKPIIQRLFFHGIHTLFGQKNSRYNHQSEYRCSVCRAHQDHTPARIHHNIGNISKTFQFLRDQKKIRRTHSLKNDPVDIPSSSAENLGFYRFFQRYLCSFLVKCHYQLLIGTTGKGNELCTDPSVDQSSLHISMFPCIIPVNGLQSPGKRPPGHGSGSAACGYALTPHNRSLTPPELLH